jgi:hypothetical protein
MDGGFVGHIGSDADHERPDRGTKENGRRGLKRLRSDLYEEPDVKNSNGEPIVSRVLTIMLAEEY